MGQGGLEQREVQEVGDGRGAVTAPARGEAIGLKQRMGRGASVWGRFDFPGLERMVFALGRGLLSGPAL